MDLDSSSSSSSSNSSNTAKLTNWVECL
ncbi:Protein of unknown function [Cotesia congregata]|uniref:Uncharacterized protein n=1 Tax=Cotesia congregata TaxID=51543 RepID=A0A8J2H5J9_COTCN|nr:Protein of unknown function [Cotesia congregata]